MDVGFENKYKNKPNFAGFDAICLGLPGTGETSLQPALSWLLQGACYDMTKYVYHILQKPDFYSVSHDALTLLLP